LFVDAAALGLWYDWRTMLNQNPTVNCQTDDWRAVLADAVRDPVELRRLVGLADDDGATADDGPPCKYTLGTLVPRTFLDRIRPGDPRDPLLLQVMPRPLENSCPDGFCTDPLGESIPQAPCLLHKYSGRSLILTTTACGVHCRYCFRRHYPHKGENGGQTLIKRPLMERLGPAIERISADRSIREVILSGGDPLTIEDARLAELIDRLGRIAHLRRLRIHTRMPIVIPQRATSGLVDLLRSTRLSATMVVQSNHPNELSGPVEVALTALIDGGLPVLCQSVLLAGVNDNLEVLARLYERLIDMRVMPYYLHQLDRVAGAAHFEVPQPRGLELIAGLRRLLPGYAVPRYVREIPGATHKKILG
jgi:EF-P beta-lysylation protein EpmB